MIVSKKEDACNDASSLYLWGILKNIQDGNEQCEFLPRRLRKHFRNFLSV